MARRNVTLTLPADLWRQARAAAILQGTSISHIVEESLRAWLQGKPLVEPGSAPAEKSGPAGAGEPQGHAE